MATPSSICREGEKAKLVKSLSRFEPRKMGQALVIGCSMLMLSFFLVLGPSVIPFNKFEGITNGQIGKGGLYFNHTNDLCDQKGDLTAADSANRTFLCPSSKTESSDATKPICDFSDKRSDICDLKAAMIRIHGNSSTILSPTNSSREEQSWAIKPHPRKGDSTALQHVTEIYVKSSSHAEATVPPCNVSLNVTAVVFSAGGYMGNLFHDFTDILIPLFITSTGFNAEVQFLISNVHSWWIAKYRPFFRQLSKYEVLDFNKIETVRCYPHVLVGLRSHREMSIDPSRAPNSYSTADFARVMRKSYGLEREEAIKLGDGPDGANRTLLFKKPRILIIARKFTRAFTNVPEIVKMAADSGFEPVVAEPAVSSDLVQFSRIVNSCDAIMAVHGAGLTNLVFLPVNAVVIQIVPLGALESIAWIDFGRPAMEMKLRYLQYGIREEESSLVDQYERDGPVIRDPLSIHRQGWMRLRKIYLDQQSVRLDVKRFKSVLIQAIRFLH